MPEEQAEGHEKELAKGADADEQGRPSRAEAEAAVRVLLRWAHDDPTREGLIDTPARVVSAWDEFFAGYQQDPVEILSRTFSEVHGYDDMVLLRQIPLESHCEHHIVPILGVAHVAYFPDRRVVGLSKLARVVDVYAKRLQSQETMTWQIADAICRGLKPRGVAVMIDAKHQCMTTRGIRKPNVATVTTQFMGCFKDPEHQKIFLAQVTG